MRRGQEVTGQLQRGEEGRVRGWLVTLAGGRIEFTGWKDARPGKGYMLLGRVVSEGEDDRGQGQAKARRPQA